MTDTPSADTTGSDVETRLIEKSVGGDHRAFMELISPLDPKLRQLVFGMVRDQAAMQDVMQDCYLKAFRSLPKFNRKSSFSSWIYRIAYNAAIDYSRKHSRVTPISGDLIETALAPMVPTETNSARRLDIERAVSLLSEEHRAVVLLVDAQGMSLRDASDALGVPSGTVGSRLFHARKQLRQHLGNYMEEER